MVATATAAGLCVVVRMGVLRFGLGDGEVAAAGDLVVAGEDAGDGFRVGLVFLFEDALGQGVGVIGGQDGDGALEDDDAVVEVFVDEVDGAAGEGAAVVEGLGLGVEAGEGGKQRGVDVEDALGEGGDEGRREQAHVSGQADEIDLMLAEAGDDVGVMLGAGAATGDEAGGGKAEAACGVEAGRVLNVGEDDGDGGCGDASVGDGLGDGEEVGAAAGEQDAEPGGSGRVRQGVGLGMGGHR